MVSIPFFRRLINFQSVFSKVCLFRFVNSTYIIAFSSFLLPHGGFVIFCSIVPKRNNPVQSWQLGGQILGMMWSLKFFITQDWVFLLVWHCAKSCCKWWGSSSKKPSQSRAALPPPTI